MTREPPSHLSETLPESHLRLVARHWRLSKLFAGDQGEEYLDWLRDQEQLLVRLWKRTPSPHALRGVLAKAIVDEERFLDFVDSHSHSQQLHKKEVLDEVAQAAAGYLLALYLDYPAHMRQALATETDAS